MDLHIFREFSQPLECLDEPSVNKEKVFYCSYKMILNTTSKAGESTLISSGFDSND